VTSPEAAVTTRAPVDRVLDWSIGVLVIALAIVVGLQVVARHLLRQPLPWTEEIARVLLVWLMCAGGVSALRHAQHPRVTAVIRYLSERRRKAVDRGLRVVLLGFFAALIVPAARLTIASAGETLPASGLSGAVISGVLPAALLLMSVVLIGQLIADGAGVWRDRTDLAWSLGAAGVVLASVFVPLTADAAPLVVLISGFLTTAALGVPLAFTLALTSLTYLAGIGGVSLIILPIKILGGIDSFVLLAIPLFILAGDLMESGGISERIVDLAIAIVGRVRGGLAMVVVVAEILFSGISGSTAADVSAISSLLVPSMRRAGYSGAESVSVVSAASAMGILVPPCLTMVVLGSLVNLSIVTLFLAGFVPAFILAASLLGLIAIRARRHAWPIAAPRAPGDFGRALRRATVPSGLPIVLFGGIFSGATTVTEAALIAVVYAFVAGLFLGDLSGEQFIARVARSGVVTATTLWVLAAASAFAWDPGARMGTANTGRADRAARRRAHGVLSDHDRHLRRDRIAARRPARPADLRADPVSDQPQRRHRSRALRHRHRRRDGHRVLSPAGGVGLAIASGIARVNIDDVSRTYVPYLIALLIGLAVIAAWPFLTLVLPRLILGYR
jgi:C4-dicarboxylate transporter DctM subunit